LLAVMSSMYAVYHGPEGLKQIALRVHGLGLAVSESLAQMGIENLNGHFFDTLRFQFEEKELLEIKSSAEAKGMNFRFIKGGQVMISFDETHTPADAEDVIAVFAEALQKDSVE